MKLSQRDRAMIAVLGLGLVLFAGWWFSVRPSSADAASARTELESVQTQLATSRRQLAQTSAAPIGRTARTARTVRLSKAAPPASRVPEAIVEVQRLAVRSGVVIDSIQTAAATDLLGVATGHPMTLVVEGSFFAVDDFLYRLEHQVRAKGQRIVKVNGRLFVLTKADVTLDTEQDGLKRPGDVTATLQLQAVSSGSATADAAAAIATPAATTPAPGATTP